MKKGRPSSAPKKLKDGYYMSITLKNTKKPIRIMRETIQEIEHAKEKFKNHEFQYIGQVVNNFWVDGINKGKRTT
ncbi:hypothetical protein OAK24_01490 [Flavobacteriales bacterium]|nr:hypothetical protein [Flavobacteriales bacterium]